LVGLLHPALGMGYCHRHQGRPTNGAWVGPCCKRQDARGQYSYKPEYPEYAHTWQDIYLRGWLIRPWHLQIGAASSEYINGRCQPYRMLAAVLVHEFMHSDNAYWYQWIEVHFGGRKIPGRPHYEPGENMEMWYNIVGGIFADDAQPCFDKAVKKCCGCKK